MITRTLIVLELAIVIAFLAEIAGKLGGVSRLDPIVRQFMPG